MALLELEGVVAGYVEGIDILNGVHPTIKDTIMETILRMNREEGVTFLIVSHEMATLRRLAPRVSVMHEGKLIAEGTFEEIASHAAVLEAYLGR